MEFVILNMRRLLLLARASIATHVSVDMRIVKVTYIVAVFTNKNLSILSVAMCVIRHVTYQFPFYTLKVRGMTDSTIVSSNIQYDLSLATQRYLYRVCNGHTIKASWHVHSTPYRRDSTAGGARSHKSVEATREI